MPRPAAYLRKSKDSATKAEHLDRLLTTVARYGHGRGDAVVYDDWARSGDQRKLASRKAWRDLCAAIERGEHDVVFMNDLDRGGRSLEEWLRFIRVAQDHRVRVVADDTDYSAPENKDRLIFEAWLAERELDAAKRRAAATIRMRA
ncbi:MAG: recombinase family protein, partial [Chloroflexota bacterium]|nr:recombinase family protein [Chloroflexota bacterium]